MDYAGYERTEEKLHKTNHALKVFNEFLSRQNTNYVAGGQFTRAVSVKAVILTKLSTLQRTLPSLIYLS